MVRVDFSAFCAVVLLGYVSYLVVVLKKYCFYYSYDLIIRYYLTAIVASSELWTSCVSLKKITIHQEIH